jgi:hypothetical protein
MAPYTVGIILLIYHDHLRQYVTADIHFIADNASCQARDCAGRKRSASRHASSWAGRRLRRTHNEWRPMRAWHSYSGVATVCQ